MNKPNTKYVKVRVEKELIGVLEAIAKLKGKSPSEITVDAIIEFLEDFPESLFASAMMPVGPGDEGYDNAECQTEAGGENALMPGGKGAPLNRKPAMPKISDLRRALGLPQTIKFGRKYASGNAD